MDGWMDGRSVMNDMMTSLRYLVLSSILRVFSVAIDDVTGYRERLTDRSILLITGLLRTDLERLAVHVHGLRK